MRSHGGLLVTGVLTLALMFTLQTVPQSVGGSSVSANGIVNATDDFGGFFPGAATFAINAGQRPDGSGYGHLNLVGRRDFAAAWGACPFDPRCVPGFSTFTFHLVGEVESVETNGDQVVVSGTVDETDHAKGGGIVFTVEDDPFTITFEQGSDSFIFQFCLVPPFVMEMANGHLSVNAPAPSALVSKPRVMGARAASAMPCPKATPQ